MMTACHTCGQSFTQRNYLSRHFRQRHSMLWQAMEELVKILEDTHRPSGTCFCRPRLRTKHVCVVIQQFALRVMNKRYFQSEQISPPVLDPSPMPPLMTMVQLVRLCLHWGCVDLLLNRRSLRMTLTRTCILCKDPWPCYTSDIFVRRLKTHQWLQLLYPETTRSIDKNIEC